MAMFSEAPREFTASDIPAPEIINPNSVTSYRWGFIGAGDIAEVMASAMAKHTNQRVVAVGSRTPGKGKAFAEKHNIARSYETYEELANDPEVDIVYVATLPHTHLADALIAINAGKHVLIEKPSTMTAHDTEILYRCAREKGVFAMEAMWSRYLPQASIIRQMLAAGTLGEITMLQSDFGQDNRDIARLWLRDASIVMDMGIYPISFAQMVLGSPSKITAAGKMHNGEVEAMAAAVLEYESGARAVLATSGHSHIPTIASISGDMGVLTMDGPFFIPTSLEVRPSLFNSHGPRWKDETGVVGHEGLSYQATYMAKFIDEGLTESPLHTHAEVVEGIRIGEEIRRQVGVVYP
jgi:predicted dehydrogenase